ncbi:MAG TPA: 2-amino-4-hydroxy-6-hydroxymethyldihydropteridine diphosphokinase [Caulobacteraceae bacterium]
MNKTSSLDEAVIVALGSNLRGDYASCELLLEAAIASLADAGLRVTDRSGWWRSRAWPQPSSPDYLNGVVFVETRLDPHAVLAALLAVEARFGRVRGHANAPRTLDLDLIAHGRVIAHEPGLTIPHPRAAARRFVMGPLAQIAPTWRHPLSDQTALALAASASVGADARPQAVTARRTLEIGQSGEA